MDIKHKSRTLGPRSAQLVTQLLASDTPVFTLEHARSLLRGSPSAVRSLVWYAEQRGLVRRLKEGLYTVVPLSVGDDLTDTYAPDPLIIVGALMNTYPYYVGYGSAMEIHRMVTQPHQTIWVASSKLQRPQTIGGYRFRPVYTPAWRIFGTTLHWPTDAAPVQISDLERTVLDGMWHPTTVGGITEIAKGLWMRREMVRANILVDYALRLKVGAAIRRLGYIMELYEIGRAEDRLRLHDALTETYAPLDPDLARTGKHIASWRLLCNVPEAELLAVRFG